MPYRRPTMVRFSSPVRFSSTAAYWPARPMCRRSSTASRSASSPATRIVPASARRRVVRTRTAVVLPAPLGPRSPRTVPGSASRSTPSRARTSPKRLTRPVTLIAGGIPGGYERLRTGNVLVLWQAWPAMSETSGRLLKLLSLLQARRDWPGEELARRLEVSVRTIRRDVERLRRLGYPVDALPGPAGGYRLHAGTAMPPLLLDDDEAVAIAVGLRTAAGASVSGIEETSIRALVKLEQVLPSHLRRRVNALQSATATIVAPGPTIDPELLTTIAGACRDHERLRFTYRRRDGTESRRRVEPHSLVNLGRR